MKKASLLYLKCAVAICAFVGVVGGLFRAQTDGYSHWSKRLLYFTAQSNLWLGITYLFLVFFSLRKSQKNGAGMRRLYIFRYIFVVCITMTGVVFCTLLAPFADDNYHVWSWPNVFTHVITPALAIIDFFADKQPPASNKRWAGVTVLPALFYFAFTSVLCLLHVDFGRGDAYPYFFMNYFSPVGLFGFSKQIPFVMGSVYWYLIFGCVQLAFAFLYARLVRRKNRCECK